MGRQTLAFPVLPQASFCCFLPLTKTSGSCVQQNKQQQQQQNPNKQKWKHGPEGSVALWYKEEARTWKTDVRTNCQEHTPFPLNTPFQSDTTFFSLFRERLCQTCSFFFFSTWSIFCYIFHIAVHFLCFSCHLWGLGSYHSNLMETQPVLILREVLMRQWMIMKMGFKIWQMNASLVYHMLPKVHYRQMVSIDSLFSCYRLVAMTLFISKMPQ